MLVVMVVTTMGAVLHSPAAGVWKLWILIQAVEGDRNERQMQPVWKYDIWCHCCWYFHVLVLGKAWPAEGSRQGTAITANNQSNDLTRRHFWLLDCNCKQVIELLLLVSLSLLLLLHQCMNSTCD